MDLLLLFCAAVTLKMPVKKFRLVLGAMVGTGSALLTVFIHGFWAYPTKLASLLAMCVVAVGFGKKLFWYILLVLAYTFVTGGAIVGIFNLFSVPFVSENGFCYNMPVPLFVYFVAVALVVFLCYSLAIFVKQTKKIAPHLRKVKLTLNQTYTLSGFCDSGNTVTCESLPVCFVTKSFKGFTDYFAECVLCGKTKSVKVVTLTGEKLVTAVPAKVSVDGTEREIYLALPVNKCRTQYELLLNGDFCAEQV